MNAPADPSQPVETVFEADGPSPSPAADVPVATRSGDGDDGGEAGTGAPQGERSARRRNRRDRRRGGDRSDRIDDSGSISLRFNSKMFHIGVGRAHTGTRVRLYIADLDVRIVTLDGELLRHLEIDPTRPYHGRDREIT